VRLKLRELAVEVATPQFARTMRMICLLSLGGLIVSEVAPLITPAFPSDLFATTIMCVLLAAVALLARPGVPRRHLGLLAIALLAAMGWYMERVIYMSGGVGSPHQGTLYIVIIAAHALMPFNVLEFFVAAGVFVAVFIGMSMVHESIAPEHLSVVIFYVTVAIVM
jgi:hypothetical protein